MLNSMYSKESASVSRWSKRRNIVYFAWFVNEKDKLYYSKYGSTKNKNVTLCALSSGEVNLEFDDPSLVAVAKRLEIMTSDKDGHSANVLCHQGDFNKFTCNYKPDKSNWEAKDSREKATDEKRFLMLLKTQVINQKSFFPLWDLLIEVNDMYEKYDCEVEITRTKELKKLIKKRFWKKLSSPLP